MKQDLRVKRGKRLSANVKKNDVAKKKSENAIMRKLQKQSHLSI